MKLVPHFLREFASVAQVGFYSIAILDRWIPDVFAIKRLTSPIRTFVILITAALFACKILFQAPQRLWKETKVRMT